MDGGWILKNARATKIKIDHKMSLSDDGTNRDNFTNLIDIKLDDIKLDRDKIISANKLAEIKTEEEQKQHEACITEVAAEVAPQKAARKTLDKEATEAVRKAEEEANRMNRAARMLLNEKPHREYWKEKSLRDAQLIQTSSPEGGHGYPSSEVHEFTFTLPYFSTDQPLNCRLRSTHYTISQDHTSGLEALEDSLLASFAKIRRTDKPSIPLGSSRSSPHSLDVLPSLTNGNAAAAQNGGSGMAGLLAASDYRRLLNHLESRHRVKDIRRRSIYRPRNRHNQVQRGEVRRG
jgi:hypothetical protein